MIVTTTPNVEGRRITEYCGVVAGEVIMGANIFRDFMAGIRDVIGGRSSEYEDQLIKSGKPLSVRCAIALPASAPMRWSCGH